MKRQSSSPLGLPSDKCNEGLHHQDKKTCVATDHDHRFKLNDMYPPSNEYDEELHRQDAVDRHRFKLKYLVAPIVDNFKKDNVVLVAATVDTRALWLSDKEAQRIRSKLHQPLTRKEIRDMNGLVVNGFQYPAILNGPMYLDDNIILTTRGVLMMLALDIDLFM